ncbi:secreted, membrane-associated protein, partial [Cryptosporidium felis]
MPRFIFKWFVVTLICCFLVISISSTENPAESSSLLEKENDEADKQTTESSNESDVQSIEQHEEIPSTSRVLIQQSLKRKRISSQLESQETVPESKKPSIISRKFDKFKLLWMENLLAVTIAEFEVCFLSAKALVKKMIWKKRNNMKIRSFNLAIFGFWVCGFKHNIHGERKELFKFYMKNIREVGSKLVKNYDPDVSTTSGDQNITMESFLLFLLICSFKELEGLNFPDGLRAVLRNEDEVGEKVCILGGISVFRVLSKLVNAKIVPNKKMITGKKNIEIRHPLTMKNINIQEFGLRFCMSLVELTFLGGIHNDQLKLVIFFGSRMVLTSEVFLSVDLLKIGLSKKITLPETISSLFYDSSFLNGMRN